MDLRNRLKKKRKSKDFFCGLLLTVARFKNAQTKNFKSIIILIMRLLRRLFLKDQYSAITAQNVIQNFTPGTN